MDSNITIVLLSTSHPGNIGSAMRAMETMDQVNLILVSPKKYPHPDIEAMASNAENVMQNVKVVETLDDAIFDKQIIIGTSARKRTVSLPNLNSRECGALCITTHPDSKIAILFGNERTGLSNDELMRCNYQVSIPSSSKYSSLNLAMAVQIICYEIKMAMITSSTMEKQQNNQLATSEDLEMMYEHMFKSLDKLDFFHNDDPKKLLLKLRRIYNRIHLEKSEVNIMRGIFDAIEKYER